MSIRFGRSGNLVVEAGVQSATVTFTTRWNDQWNTSSVGLTGWSIASDDGGESWTRTADRPDIGSSTRTFTVSGNRDSVKRYTVSYTSPTGRFTWESDNQVSFLDNGSGRTTVTLSFNITSRYSVDTSPPPPPSGDTTTPVNSVVQNGPTSCPSPIPWANLLPSCGNPPIGISSSDGLQISKTGNSQITLNLRNYANRLVTLKVTHQASGSWTQGFGFNVPTCSDISPSTGGTPYARGAYSNLNISGTNVFYIYNIDGGDYNYTFNHSSIPGPRPTRTNYNLVCTTSVEVNDTGGTTTTITCVCNPFTETYPGAWPHCPTGVAVSKNGGSKVQWQYEDGSGGNYNDQYVTVEVVSTRPVIPDEGPICTSMLKGSVWLQDPNNPLSTGNCIGDYKDHTDKIRFRIPSLQISKTTLPVPLCFSQFRGIAGATPPSSEQGSLSNDYSVLHIFNELSLVTDSLVTDDAITVTVLNENDTTTTAFGEIDPTTNPLLSGTEIYNRRHYEIQFNDDTTISTGAANILPKIGQNLMADGTRSTISVLRKEQVSANTIKVWFYTSYMESESATEDLIHVFNDTTNVTDTVLSELGSTTYGVVVTPQSVDDAGIGTAGFDVLNDLNKKHYLITFNDTTIIDPTASNIQITINQNRTASGLVFPMGVSQTQVIDEKNMRVWFSYNSVDGIDNEFVRDWSISRSRDVNRTGAVFARNWYLTKDA